MRSPEELADRVAYPPRNCQTVAFPPLGAAKTPYAGAPGVRIVKVMKRALLLAGSVLAFATRIAAGQGCPGNVCVVTTLVSVRVEPRLGLSVATTPAGSAVLVRANSGWSMQANDTQARASGTTGGPTDGLSVILLAFQPDSLPGQIQTVRVTLATR